MTRRLILDQGQLQITLARLGEQLIENHGDFSQTVLLGLQPRGTLLARRLQKELEAKLARAIPLGALDITFFRDDFRRRDSPIKANATNVPFIIEGKRVVLIDDVLFTGRSVRAALDAMTAFGRPLDVELLALIDRLYTRELPIESTYVGREVNSMLSQRVSVEWAEQDGHEEDAVWLIDQSDEKK